MDKTIQKQQMDDGLNIEIERAQKAIKGLVYKNHVGQELIDLENSRLDFSKTYVFLGFTQKGDKVILGESDMSGPDGERIYKKVYGTIYKREAEN